VKAAQDTLFEGDETVILTLTPSLNYQVGAFDNATVTILDDDILVFLSDPFAFPNPALPNHPVLFTVNTNAAGATYTWDFGDATPLVITQSMTTTHSYAVVGPYTVTLVISGIAAPDITKTFT